MDLHTQEATNGCIVIVDPKPPPYDDNAAAIAALNNFEPQII